MRTRTFWVAALAAAAAVALAVTVVPVDAGAHRGHDGHRNDRRHGPNDPVTVLAEGLNAPFGLDVDGKDLYVAESDAGQIVHVNLRSGRSQPAVTGLAGPSSVAKVGKHLAIVTGASAPDEEAPPPDGETPDGEAPDGETPDEGDVTVVAEPVDAGADALPNGGQMLVLLARPGGQPRVLADLLAYELEHNPDGQLQFDPETGAPLDALSNPFDIIAYGNHGSVLVADAGANAVLKVNRRGEVSTFFVPPLVTTGGCAGQPNNDPEHVGCDPVPTGLAYGPRGTLYVSTLSAEMPGEGRVYVLNARNGKVIRVISGLNNPTGVAVGDDGSVYVSDVLHNAPLGDEPPPADFDPASVGRIVKISRHGKISYAAVTMPTGLVFRNGQLYASSWSIAGFIGIADAGQVVRVSDRAFARE